MNNIKIKSVFSKKVIFEFEKKDNTIKDTVEEAVKQNVSLCYADLRGANLHGANLRGAVLHDANLSHANLEHADLSGAYLYYADLCDAKLSGADLHGANLSHANLSGVTVTNADLSGANLGYANLTDANLFGSKLTSTDFFEANLHDAKLYCVDYNRAKFGHAIDVPEHLCVPLACPSEGSFIGWKKVHDKLVKLQIPEDAKRLSATTNKCRCDKAIVLQITDLDGNNPIQEILNDTRNIPLLYKVGETVYPDSFDNNRWNECSHGIHFFIDKQSAINYKF